MNKYTIYCTEEQTRKALELGAPIEAFNVSSVEGKNAYNFPTAEQMIGWLEEQGDILNIDIHLYEDDGIQKCAVMDLLYTTKAKK